jgi:putative aldouronate transport system permease protein
MASVTASASPGGIWNVWHRVQRFAGDHLYVWAVYAFLGIVLVVVLYPLLFVAAASFSAPSAVEENQVWVWPVHFTLLGYKAVCQYQEVWQGFVNSAIYTFGGTIVSVALTIMMAYPLSRRDFVGRRLWLFVLLFALMFNGGLVPFYLVVQDLGMINTVWSMIIPSALNIFAVFVAKTFFQNTIPDELYDAARIDGAGDLRFLWKIVLPMSTPIIAVLTLWSVVGNWNSYFNALLFLNSPNLYPLQLVLRQLLILGNITANGMGFAGTVSARQMVIFQEMTQLLQYSLVMVSAVPLLPFYPLAQRYFMKGIMIGSLKE